MTERRKRGPKPQEGECLTAKILLALTPSAHDQLSALATERARSIPFLVRQAVREYLERECG